MRLLGPPQILRRHARTPEAFRQRAERVARERNARHDDGVFIARIEHGRWIADCPCGSGVAVHPEWPSAGCLECGRWWPVLVPVQWREIEAVLIVRPLPITRGWVTGETVEQLEAENTTRGLPVRLSERTTA